MPWLKTVILDILVAVIAILFVLTGQSWAKWVILIYTPLMLLLKIGAVIGAGSVTPMTTKKNAEARATAAPAWFFHGIYALMVGIFVYNQWWMMVAAWAAIWAASFFYLRRTRSAREDR